VCALCGSEELEESGLCFTLPKSWPSMYPNRLDLIRLCRALGFKEPQEATGVTNSNIASLKHVLEVYQQQYLALLKEHSIVEAKRRARDFMRDYEFNGAPLGQCRYKEGVWLYCGLEGEEEELPKEFQRDFCGKVFHNECAGLLRAPGPKVGRVPCILCLADRRHRPRAPPSENLISQVSYRPDGAPRILGSLENNMSLIRTLMLVCECGEAVGSGLPCTGMLSVARSEGAVLHHRLFHSHWFSHHLIGTLDVEAVIEGNEHLVLNVGAVLSKMGVRARPSTLEEGMEPPARVQVRVAHDGTEAQDVCLTQSHPGGRPFSADEEFRGNVQSEADAAINHEPVTTTDVGTPPKVHGGRKSRRHKPKNPKKDDQKN
jgi:hypothetical protein